jgi:TRAP-type C4-dicarboxylate transport system permease small subunit
MTRVKETLDVTLRWLCIVLLAALVVIVAWQVFARQVLSSPSTWSEELAKYTFVWLGLFGAALVFGERGHIAVDFLVRKLPEQVQRWNAVLCQLVILAFAVLVLGYGGWQVTELAWNQSVPGLPLKAGWIYLALPLSGALTVFYTVYHLVEVIRGAESGTVDAEPEAI